MPNLENLKKQAKLVLRLHRDHYHPVAAQSRRALTKAVFVTAEPHLFVA
jgi:hypothetical protein